MPQLLALEWDSREIRAVVAGIRGGRAAIEHAFSIPWNESESTAETAEKRLGEKIAAELDARGIGRPPALVAVGRTSIELRQIQLPPAPDADLPEMVRFQAAREFNELDEHWLLDFVPIDDGPSAPRVVLATAIAPAAIAQIEGVCQAAGLKLQRLLLRPCEAASLLSGKNETQGRLRLLVDLLSDEADLTVVLDGKAVFLRTTRLDGDSPSLPALMAEIRLTMAAAQNQLAGQKVEAVVLCGKEPLHLALTENIESEWRMPVESIDPFADLELGTAIERSSPSHRGRFAPLLGMILAEASQKGHAIDFLHPRRRAESPDRRRQWILAGAAAAALLLAYLVYARVDHYLLSSEVKRLEARSRSLDAQAAAAKTLRTNAAEIAKWTDGEVVWLDQLHGLNERFPAAPDAVLSKLGFMVRQTGSQASLEGAARNAEVVAKMEQAVRTAGNQIVGKRSWEDASQQKYPWRFEASISLPRRTKP